MMSDFEKIILPGGILQRGGFGFRSRSRDKARSFEYCALKDLLVVLPPPPIQMQSALVNSVPNPPEHTNVES
jgi:hypothetical protein